MSAVLEVRIGGEDMQLLADRALYWPTQRTLLIADLHLGKGNMFRAAGIPVPSGGTEHDLQRLSRLLAQTGAAALWILGDFLHGPRHAAVDAHWLQFRQQHAQVDMRVVPGNHDRAFDAEAAGVNRMAEGSRLGAIELHHAPPSAGDAPNLRQSHIVCGHLHPVLRLPGAGRYPLFWLRPGCTVLPAFSRFTGGYDIRLRQANGSALCNGEQITLLGTPS